MEAKAATSLATSTSSGALAAAEGGAGSLASPARSESELLQSFLQKTSRTFALTIPLLAEPLRGQIGVAYLLFRIIDTFEDATTWSITERVDALEAFVGWLDTDDVRPVHAAVARWTQKPPVGHAGYLELLAATPRVLDWYRRIEPSARAQIQHHLARSARGMSRFVERTDARGVLRLESLDDLRQYCYVVAGIVGEMLTELFVQSRGEGGATLIDAGPALRARSVAFGEGLQLVNILKDAGADAIDGRVYLPPGAPLAEVFTLARADLRAAAEYTEILRTSGAHRGLVTFNALNARLAIASLRALRDRGLGAKLSRVEVVALAAEVVRAVETRAPLFDLGGLDAGPI